MFDRLAESIHDDTSKGKVRRIALSVIGKVQGVGFRPYVYELARGLGLRGFVRNQGSSVLIEIEGESSQLSRFVTQIESESPPRARIEHLSWVWRDLQQDSDFRIEASSAISDDEVRVPADMATCEQCLEELADPKDRRFGYPFLNCVNCGPRLTIIESMPYDRERTTLKRFRLCGECRAEYEDVQDRRFHAQPIACPKCGPALSGFDNEGRRLESSNPLRVACEAILKGRIVALKGLGGYHLVCDARDDRVIRELRLRKHREGKPLAVMVARIECAQELCEITPQERDLLTSPQRPIVLLKRKVGAEIGAEVSLDSPFLGVMLPYTPLHSLLLQGVQEIPLVMTSGNASDYPMAYEEPEALERLKDIADLFLVHDRPIRIRCDDSVIRSVPSVPSPILMRRSRGYAPEAIALPVLQEKSMLAVGAQLKNTFALTKGKKAVLSHHIGDLDELPAFDAFRHDIAHFETLFDISPKVLVHDLHPDYLSTRYAHERASREGLKLIGVQHHHAHMASCMADHGFDGLEKVIGITFDGTGYGTDGKIWGGEFLIGDYEGFERAAHLSYVLMPGGEQAIREPWRMAMAYLVSAGVDPMLAVGDLPTTSTKPILRMIERRLYCAETSSVGRLFDAVAALMGLRTHVSFEGQAAAELEALAMHSCVEEPYPISYAEFTPGTPYQIDVSPMIRAIVGDLKHGIAGPKIANRFHAGLVDVIVRVCCELRTRRGINRVALSGGVFMNGILLSGAFSKLQSLGFQVFCHRAVPPNDGGISLGQLAVASAILKRRQNHVLSDSGKGD